MAAIGIDSGSVAVKGVAMADGELLSVLNEPAGTGLAEQCDRMIAALKEAFLPGICEPAVCITGYGREAASGARSSISEIFANALGAGWVWRNWERMREIGERFYGSPTPLERPGKFKTILDVGGQDSKVITIGKEGVLEGFAMNDRCAAGTGRFLRELVSVLELEDIRELDKLALENAEHVEISNACTVFAESEIVSMLAGGVPEARIAGGIFKAVAERVLELAESLSWDEPVLFDGGPARLDALRSALEQELQSGIAVPACPQHITAIGAAVYAGGQ